MVQAVSRRPLIPDARVRTGSVHVGFVVDKLVLGLVSLRVLLFLLSISFHHGSLYSYIILGMSNRPVGGRSLDTYSRPIDVNNEQLYSKIC
jgi:hypothetical protein